MQVFVIFNNLCHNLFQIRNAKQLKPVSKLMAFGLQNENTVMFYFKA